MDTPVSAGPWRYRYTWEKFCQATSSLDHRDRPLRDSLEAALMYLVRLRDEDLPPELLKSWRSIMTRTTWLDGCFETTLATISDDEARALEALIRDVDSRLEAMRAST